MEKSYRALHKMSLPVLVVGEDESHTIVPISKEPGDTITADELKKAGQTEDDILRLTTEHLPEDAATEGVAMCTEQEYEAQQAAIKAQAERETKINTLRSLNLSDEQIDAVLAIPPRIPEEGGIAGPMGDEPEVKS